MKNVKRKPVFVILLKDGKPEEGSLSGSWEQWDCGASGFRVRGLARVLLWKDKGKTWEPVQDEAKA